MDNMTLSPVEQQVGPFTCNGPTSMRFSVSNALFLNGRKEDANLALELTTSNTHQRDQQDVLLNDANILTLGALYDFVRSVYSFSATQAFVLFDAKSEGVFAIQSKQHLNVSLTSMRDAPPPPVGESRYEFLVVTFSKTIAGRLRQPDHVHAELKAVLQGPGPAQAPTPVTPPPRGNPARIVMRQQAGPNRTPRLRTFDLDGEVEGVPAVAPATLMPTSVVLQLPLNPRQTMITVDVANAPALLAMNSALTMTALHLGPRGLTPFTNLGGIMDIVHAMRVPANEQDRWTPEQDGALVAACRGRLDAGLTIPWGEIGDEMHREAAACERRWATIGGVPAQEQRAPDMGAAADPPAVPEDRRRDVAAGQATWTPAGRPAAPGGRRRSARLGRHRAAAGRAAGRAGHGALEEAGVKADGRRRRPPSTLSESVTLQISPARAKIARLSRRPTHCAASTIISFTSSRGTTYRSRCTTARA
jgi:hypothetical protein